MGCASSKDKIDNKTTKEQKQIEIKSPSTKQILNINAQKTQNSVLKNSMPPIQHNLYYSYPQIHRNNNNQLCLSLQRPFISHKTSELTSNNQITKYSINATQKKWLSLSEIFSLPIEKQKKYWSWYVGDYQEQLQNNKDKIENPYARLSLEQVYKILTPQSKARILFALKSNPPEKPQIKIPPISSQTEEQIQKKQLKFQNKLKSEQDQQIYVMRQNQHFNAFIQTQSFEIYQDSEMSKIQVDLD